MMRREAMTISINFLQDVPSIFDGSFVRYSWRRLRMHRMDHKSAVYLAGISKAWLIHTR
jgi:hypothetical protein